MAELYRIVVRVQLNKVEQTILGPQRMEKTLTAQITEGFGEGATPHEACAAAFRNGIEAYIDGLSGLSGPTEVEKAIITDN